MEQVKIFLAAHKKAPQYGDSCYQFIHVGAANSAVMIDGALRDDASADNISQKNDIYCELTGLFYIWKHVHDVEITGLGHYRRLLANQRFAKHPNDQILTQQEIVTCLKTHDIILPTLQDKGGQRHGYFRTVEERGEFCPYRLVVPVIKELYPEYVDDFDKEFLTPEMSFANMLICRKELFDEYCEWLFNILFRVEENLKHSIYGVAPREMGYFSEWLLNVWVRHKKLEVCYKPIFFIEDNINWHYQVKYAMQQMGLANQVAKIERYITRKKNL